MTNNAQVSNLYHSNTGKEQIAIVKAKAKVKAKG
jgi:hypothetical protein